MVRVPAAPAVRGWAPPAGAEPPYAPRVVRTSRVRGGVMSFGIVGRSLFTLVYLAVLAVIVFSRTLVPLVLWVFLVGPVWMREVWKRTPVS